MEKVLFICYPRCTTCIKAKQWLTDKGIDFTLRDIKENNPSYSELLGWWKKSGLPLNKFFNTSGLIYKENNLKDKLPVMTDEEKLTFLSSNGMAVKRPILVVGERVLVGFKEKDWQQLFC